MIASFPGIACKNGQLPMQTSCQGVKAGKTTEGIKTKHWRTWNWITSLKSSFPSCVIKNPGHPEIIYGLRVFVAYSEFDVTVLGTCKRNTPFSEYPLQSQSVPYSSCDNKSPRQTAGRLYCQHIHAPAGADGAMSPLAAALGRPA